MVDEPKSGPASRVREYIAYEHGAERHEVFYGASEVAAAVESAGADGGEVGRVGQEA